MKSRSLILLAAALLALNLAGCKQAPAALSSGTYAAEQDASQLSPSLTLDMDNQIFTFTHDSLAAYLSAGSFTLDDDTLTAATDDGRYTYVFRLTDEDTLTFVPEESSLLPSRSGQTPETDQIIFHLREETI